jgi:hypothetical protein
MWFLSKINIQQDKILWSKLHIHDLVAGLLARSKYLEGLVTGHLGTGFSWFPCV